MSKMKQKLPHRINRIKIRLTTNRPKYRSTRPPKRNILGLPAHQQARSLMRKLSIWSGARL